MLLVWVTSGARSLAELRALRETKVLGSKLEAWTKAGALRTKIPGTGVLELEPAWEG